MTKKDNLRILDYLEHILEALKRVFEYLDDIDEVQFLTNALVQDAVLHNLEILGEASKNLLHYYPDFTSQHSDIPWETMYWMRNRISHGYFAVDFEIVWKTIEQDLPILEEQVRTVYGQLKNMKSLP